MSLETRIQKLEGAVGPIGPGSCACARVPGGSGWRFADPEHFRGEPSDDVLACAVCGRPRPVVAFVEESNWRPGEQASD